MKTVNDVLQIKGRDVWTIEASAKVFEALTLMDEKGIGALVVMDGDKIAGIISERDYARNVILKGKSSKDCPVSDIMTREVLYVKAWQTMENCMALITEKHVRHLPVMEGDHLAGLISIGDVVKAIISDKQSVIDQMQSYILGR
ncbi:MAG: CBS domain-containing protein [Candidatus Sumerlaeota bacterium]|nr:CBS domain-containing protein [Candidatus Sumerlaeota bacterium]